MILDVFRGAAGVGQLEAAPNPRRQTELVPGDVKCFFLIPLGRMFSFVFCSAREWFRCRILRALGPSSLIVST